MPGSCLCIQGLGVRGLPTFAAEILPLKKHLLDFSWLLFHDFFVDILISLLPDPTPKEVFARSQPAAVSLIFEDIR